MRLAEGVLDFAPKLARAADFKVVAGNAFYKRADGIESF